MIAYLRLVRAGTLFSPGADVVAGLCLAGLAWSGAAISTVFASIALYAGGMILNDHADRALDAEVRPERPLPSGAIAPGTALALGLTAIALSIALSAWPLYHAVMAVLVIGYDYLLKKNAWVGALVMGTLRAMNLCAGTVALTHAAPPRVLLIAAAAYGVYIIAVTILGILEDEKRPAPRAVLSIQLVPPLSAALALLAAPSAWPAGIAFVLAGLFLARARRIETWTQAAIRGSMTWLLLGTMLYTALLCLASGRPIEAAAIAAAAVVARKISRHIALT